MVLEQPRDIGVAEQRDIGVSHEHWTPVVRQHGARALHGAASAGLLLLDHVLDIVANRASHIFRPVAHYDDDALGPGAPHGVHHTQSHRTAIDMHGGLGLSCFHPGALAGGKDNRGKAAENPVRYL